MKEKVKVLVAQSCPTLCDPMDCSLPGSSVPGIPQVRILGWITIPFSRVSSQPRDWTQVSCTAGGFFTLWATREPQELGTPDSDCALVFGIRPGFLTVTVATPGENISQKRAQSLSSAVTSQVNCWDPAGQGPPWPSCPPALNGGDHVSIRSGCRACSLLRLWHRLGTNCPPK